MARRTKEDAEKTREMLLDAAESVFLEKGVANASLEDIARHAGMTRGAVYWHFENKQALFEAMHKRVELPLDREFQQVMTANDGLQALQEHCLYVLKHFTKDERARNVLTILMLKCEELGPDQSNVQRMCSKRDEIIASCHEIFKAAQENGRLADHITPDVAANALHAYIHGILCDSVSYGYDYDVARHGNAMLDIFFRGIRKSA